MQMPDVNVLVYAHYKNAIEHDRYREWLTDLTKRQEPFALSELVLHGFLRVVTNQRVFGEASTMASALEFIQALRSQPGCHLVRPGPVHWEIFRELCVRANAKGPLVADAVHAAVAIEHGCEWVTNDTDFARFAPRLRWRLI
jgi:toxin-antitoxin system PIN domain toxin